MIFSIWQAPFEQSALAAIDAEYDPGWTWRHVWSGTVPEFDAEYIRQGGDPRVFCEVLFTQFQRVDDDHMPPIGYEGRSLTAGDLVHLTIALGWFFCAGTGWQIVEPPECTADLPPLQREVS